MDIYIYMVGTSNQSAPESWPLIMIQTRNGFSPPDRQFFEAQALSRSATTYEVLILLLSEASGPGALRRVRGTGMKSLRNAEDE